MTKLYEIPRGSKIHVGASDGSKYIIFNNPDGMYSHCTTEKGATVHLGINSDLEPFEDGYRIVPIISTDHINEFNRDDSRA